MAANYNKKRKLSDTKMQSIVKYSDVKIPAYGFLEYLVKNKNEFVTEILAHDKKGIV